MALKETYGLDVPLDELQQMGRAEMEEKFAERIQAKYEEKERQVGPELMLFHERMIMLQIVDTQWKDHLYALDHLKEGIGLRGYGQRDPARRVQERVVRDVPGPHGPHRRGDPALGVPVSGDGAAGACAGAAFRGAGAPQALGLAGARFGVCVCVCVCGGGRRLFFFFFSCFIRRIAR